MRFEHIDGSDAIAVDARFVGDRAYDVTDADHVAFSDGQEDAQFSLRARTLGAALHNGQTARTGRRASHDLCRGQLQCRDIYQRALIHPQCRRGDLHGIERLQ